VYKEENWTSENSYIFTIFTFIRIIIFVHDILYREMMRERVTITPNFHLRLYLTIIRFLGTWPPLKGKYRSLYLIYTFCSFVFILGILIIAEIGNLFSNWPDMSKILSPMNTPILLTNCVQAFKVIAFSFHAIFADNRSG